MIFLFRILLISSLCFLAALFTPWWSALVISFIIAFILPGNNLNAFLSGFLGNGLLWMIMAWKIDIETGSILSEKMVFLFPIFDDKSMMMIAVGLIGGVVGAFGAYSGNSFRQLFIKKKTQNFYNL